MSVIRDQFSNDNIPSEAKSEKFCPNNYYEIHVMDRQATIVVLV